LRNEIMKRFKLAAVAAASLVAASFAHAGILSVTPVQYAAESFSATGAAAVAAPLFNYSMSSAFNTGSNPSFTYDFTLNGANWNFNNTTSALSSAALPGVPALAADGTALAVTITNPNNILQIATAASVVKVSDTVFRATFNSASWVGTALNVTFPVGSFVTIGTNVAGKSPSVYATAATSAPANSCTPTPVNVTLATVMKDATGAVTIESNGTLDPIAAQSGTYLVSNSAISATIDAVAVNETSKVDVINTLLLQTQGTFFTTGAGTDSVIGTPNATIQLGRLVIKDRGSFSDASPGATGPYSVFGGFAGGVSAGATALLGNANLSAATIKVNGNFVVGAASSVNLTSDAACATVIAGPFVPTATNVTMNLTAAQLATMVQTGAAGNGTGVQTAYICYTVANTNAAQIPSGQFTLDASSTVSHLSSEAGGPVCGTNLYNLTKNGVQIDVRNVIARASGGYTAGFRSFLRIINTDESLSTVVAAQVIDNAGNVLGAKPLNGGVAIPPRGYIFVSNDQLETALAGSTSAGYTDAAGANVRIRLSAPSATLRVQNYVLTPQGTFLEASGAQADEGVNPANNSIFLNK
jgi:hypothetical protein